MSFYEAKQPTKTKVPKSPPVLEVHNSGHILCYLCISMH